MYLVKTSPGVAVGMSNSNVVFQVRECNDGCWYGTPTARAIGSTRLIAIVFSFHIADCCVRFIQIRFFVSSLLYSSMFRS